MFFKFWDVDVEMFRGVVVCPLFFTSRLIFGMYDVKYRRIYLQDMSDIGVFFHEASHHIAALLRPWLKMTFQGRMVEELVADIAAAVAVKEVQAPRGVGWVLIDVGLSCRFDENDLFLPDDCVLTKLKKSPELILTLFS